jgi:hypothetical protein
MNANYTADDVRTVIERGPHVFVAGVTGFGMGLLDTGGKTSTANWWFSELVDNGWRDYGIYFNPSGDKPDGPRIAADATVNTVQELGEALAGGASKVEFVPQSTDGAAEHANLAGFVRKFHSRTGLSSVVVHDEARFYAGTDSMRWFAARGSDVDCRSLVLSQHPWDIPESIVTNLHVFVWVGPVSDQAKRWFQSVKDEEQYQHAKSNEAAYHWSIFLGGEYLATMKPVPEKYA